MLNDIKRLAAGVLCGAALFCCVGCNARGGADLSVDETSAKDSLIAVLDCWKSGGQPADLKNGSPSIIARDFEWEAGSTLVSYALAEDERNDGANLHALVDLTLKTEDGGESLVRAKYIVGTEPVITVFRTDEELYVEE